MTTARAVALFVAVVGSLLYLKFLVFSPARGWESYNNAGMVAYDEKDYAEAERQFTAALRKLETFPYDDPNLIRSLNNLTEVYRVQGKYAEAGRYIKRSLAIAEKAYGPEHPNVAVYLNNLAGNFRDRGMYTEAEPLLRHALEIWEKTFGRDHPLVAFALKNHVSLLRRMGRDREAESYEARIKPSQPDRTGGNREN